MPRFPRSDMKTSFFHVVAQGMNKNYIFEKAEDIEFYIKLMYKLSKEHKVEIISYCVMSNHVHILINTNEITEMSKFMQRLNLTYGMYYNKKYNKVGHVFRNRFESEGIYDEKHLYNCEQYIYNNPVKEECVKGQRNISILTLKNNIMEKVEIIIL